MSTLTDDVVNSLGDLAPEPKAITFHNYHVQYVAPTKPEHTFEPRCAILANDSEFNDSVVRVFDVPDPDESQIAVAGFACRAMNTHHALISALEEARRLLAIAEIHHGYCMTIDAALWAAKREA